LLRRMGEVTEESRPKPFHERFDIEVGADAAKRWFINRATNEVFDHMRSHLHQSNYEDVKRAVASSLGIRYKQQNAIESYVGGDFQRCLQALEAVYDATEGYAVHQEVSDRISSIVRRSEIDLGVDWQPPIFVRIGAHLLDEQLVNEPLRWLSEPRYTTVYEPFEKGLHDYVEAINSPNRLSDVVTEMYVAIEALARVVTGRNRDLSGNREMFISRIGASEYYKQLLRDYITYANQYRHATQQNRTRPPLTEPEVEAFIYLTGLFIRLAIRTT
jgi:hypothetical protein